MIILRAYVLVAVKRSRRTGPKLGHWEVDGRKLATARLIVIASTFLLSGWVMGTPTGKAAFPKATDM